MPEWLTYVGAAGLGAVAGVILALARWRVLRPQRPQVDRPGLWLPANALAWLLGMPIVLLGMGGIPADATIPQAIPIDDRAVAASLWRVNIAAVELGASGQALLQRQAPSFGLPWRAIRARRLLIMLPASTMSL